MPKRKAAAPNRSFKVADQIQRDLTELIRIVATVSKGTYIRTLGEDIGEALGCGAHLRSLRRLSTGDFDATRCITLDGLEAMDETERLACLLPVESLVSGHGRVTLQADDAARFLSGLRRRGEWADADEIAVFGSQPVAFLGTAHARARELIPGRLLNPIEIQQILLNAPVNATFCETTP